MSSRHHAIANTIGQRVAELLACEPDAFWACRDGLAVSADNVRDHVLRDDIPHALCIAAMASCGWCLRVSWQAWAFDPECFAIDYADDVLPAGVHDVRALPLATVVTLMTGKRVAA